MTSKIIFSYCIISIAGGVIFMMIDVITGFNYNWLRKVIVGLYAPPFIVGCISLAYIVLRGVWE